MTWSQRYGADTVRAYLMFFARWDMGAPGTAAASKVPSRWLRRVWTLFTEPSRKGKPLTEEVIRNLRRKVHQTLRQVTHDFETFEFNTIVSGLMELLNEMYKAREQGAAGTPAWDGGPGYLPAHAGSGLPRILPKSCGHDRASPIRSIPSPGPRWMKPRLQRMRLPWSCRSTARCATGSPCRPS